jgi:RNA polymerase I-specific transcription initiation factor RRN3
MNSDPSSCGNTAPNGLILLQAFINSALCIENYKSSKFDLLLKQLHKDINEEPNPLILSRWLQSFTLCVSSFDDCKHTDIIGLLLSIKWYTYELYDDYADFVENLVSAQSTYSIKVISLLLQQLKECIVLEDGDDKSNRALDLVMNILEITPTAVSNVIQLVKSSYPNNFDPLKVHLKFIRSMFELTEKYIVLKPHVLELVMIKVLQLDVEIQVKIEELDDDDIELVEQYMETEEEELFDMEHILSSDLTMTNMQDRIEEGSDACRVVLHSLIKLDKLMIAIFDYIQQSSSDEVFFKHILQIFERTVLRTFKSRYIQFVLFKFTSYNPEYHNMFLSHLLAIPFKKSVPIAVKLNSIAYLSSFMARAKFLKDRQVYEAYALLISWCERYIDECQDNYIDYEKHLLFYSISQTLFYVFCFRHKLFLKQNMLKVSMERIIFSRLNPLYVCLDSIVDEFARLASDSNFVYCYSLIEKNARESMREKVEKNNADDRFSQKLLEAFFPFDPYKLFSSKSYIAQDLYVNWGE